jgi:hypothetical protein
MRVALNINMEFFNNLSNIIVGFPTEINVFIYKINKKREPFIEFILEKNDNNYILPKFIYDLKITQNYSTFILNRAILLMQQILQNHDRIDISIKNNIYKGCLQKENELFLFLDCSILFEFLENKYIYVIIDEVIYQSTINNIPINNTVKDFILSNSELIEKCNQPLLLFGCKIEEEHGMYKSIEEYENISRILNPIYGNYFYFTKEVLGDKIAQRFAVFTNNNYLTTQFTENGIDYWRVKTEYQFVKI